MHHPSSSAPLNTHLAPLDEDPDDVVEELGTPTSYGPEYTPLSADDSFSQALEVDVRGLSVRAYYTPSSDQESPTIVVAHHGAGFGGLSFACLAKDIAERTHGKLGFLAYDARGHGYTKDNSTTEEEDHDVDYSLETLAEDLVVLLKELFPENPPQFLLLGHSMGGAVVTQACPDIQSRVGKVLGACLLDIVEGTAMEALPNMMTIINARPTTFNSLQDAIGWHVHSGTVRSATSARISVPSLVKKVQDEPEKYMWRTNLHRTEKYWKGWYSSLSSKFLALRAAKLLVLAGTDRLDKSLMIGQMQGKYQLVVLQEVGHSIHEDAPGRLGETVVEFWKRNDQTDILKNVKKVGQK